MLLWQADPLWIHKILGPNAAHGAMRSGDLIILNSSHGVIVGMVIKLSGQVVHTNHLCCAGLIDPIWSAQAFSTYVGLNYNLVGPFSMVSADKRNQKIKWPWPNANRVTCSVGFIRKMGRKLKNKNTLIFQKQKHPHFSSIKWLCFKVLIFSTTPPPV